MPLHDLPPNLSRNVTSNRHSSKTRHHDDSLAAALRPPPLGVMGMLKNTTELGDVGIFAQRPPRVPRSGTQSSLGGVSNSGSQYSQRHKSNIPEQTSVRSGHRPHPSAGGSIRRYGPAALDRPFGDVPHQRRSRPYPPHYLSSHHRIPRSLHTYRSLSALRDGERVVAMSPSSYYRDDRGVRSGAVSPATSNFYEYDRMRRSHWDREGSIRTRASSPISMLTVDQSLHDYCTNYNNPIRPLHRASSPAIRSGRAFQPHARSISGAGTPAVGISARHRVNSQTSLASVARSTASNVPQWYDYSESFAEEDEYSVIGPAGAMGASVELDAVATANTPPPPSLLMHKNLTQKRGSAELLVELPASHSRKPSQLSARSRHSRHHSNQSRHSRGSLGKLEEHEQESIPILSKEALDEKPPSAVAETVQLSAHSNGLTRTKSPASRVPESQSILFSNASRSPRNLSALAARAHSPCGDENSDVSLMSIVASDAVQIQKEDPNAVRHVLEVKKDFSLPALSFRPLSLDLSNSRPSTAPGSPNRPSFPILSPTPERPASSQSRERFSKILDIDQDPPARVASRSGSVIKNTIATKLETVTEAVSPSKTPKTIRTNTFTPSGIGHQNDTARASRRVDEDELRTSYIVSNDPSTVDSLLDKHIECLGLGLDGQPISETDVENSQSCGSDVDTIHGSSYFVHPSTEGLVKLDIHSRSTTHEDCEHDQQLVPRKLFASLNEHVTDAPTINSGLELSTSYSRDTATLPSFGWQPLTSQSQLDVLANTSRPTILSGEYADVELSRTTQPLQGQSSPNPVCNPTVTSYKLGEERVVPQQPKARRAASEEVSRSTSKQRRKMKIHLRSPSEVRPQTTNAATVTKTLSEKEVLANAGLSRVPVSTIDGFAEMIGDSVFNSQQSLRDVEKHDEESRAPPSSKWSNIVAAMPLPGKTIPKVPRKSSVSTMRSIQSTRSITKPENSSRITVSRVEHEVKAQSSVPQLGLLDLGPSIRPSQFGLDTSFALQSPRLQPSMPDTHFSLPDSLPGGTQRGSRTRWRLHSLRHILPKSPRATMSFKPPQDGRYPVSGIDHILKSRPSYQDQYCTPATASTIACQKQRLKDRMRVWWSRQCLPQRFMAGREKMSETISSRMSTRFGVLVK